MVGGEFLPTKITWFAFRLLVLFWSVVEFSSGVLCSVSSILNAVLSLN